jgi:glutamine synthetase
VYLIPYQFANIYKVRSDAKANAGVQFLVGFETEFILLKSTSPIEAVNYHGWSNSQALASGSVEAKVLHEIAEALMKSGIELQMYHAEAAPGQVRSLCSSIMQCANRGLIV